MADYIERDKALDAVLQLPPKMDEQGYGWLGRRGVWQMLSDFPPADVAPVKHGKWIQLTQNVEPTALKCSLCGEISCCHGMYCPDCGARMDGEDNG